MQNCFCESCNRRMRDEILNESQLLGLDLGHATIATWANDYIRRQPSPCSPTLRNARSAV
ncbi:Integrase core domain [Pannonibacter indicus]|uniref:Integrase core domain n=1 Tax=Pannonibacter indicus TaxID=466044 RepID=A0A0K6I6Y2_9HYPH|nr:Integrase core domain [Pannonibacter indicus]